MRGKMGCNMSQYREEANYLHYHRVGAVTPLTPRRAIEAGDPDGNVYKNNPLPLLSRLEPKHLLARPLVKRLLATTYPVTLCGLCPLCERGYWRDDDTHFVRSPLWERGIAMFACTNALLKYDADRLEHWHEWCRACAILFYWYPPMRSAAQALRDFGRRYLIAGPPYRLLTEIGTH
jgi:hypothetical protein